MAKIINCKSLSSVSAVQLIYSIIWQAVTNFPQEEYQSISSQRVQSAGSQKRKVSRRLQDRATDDLASACIRSCSPVLVRLHLHVICCF